MRISIVTVTLNDKDNIERTILSVIGQKKNFEYIIIDGGSTDGTLKIINKFKDKIDFIISDEDDGIYDAMNKAVDIANGDWVCFMNSGDTFVDDEILSKLLEKKIDKNTHVIYGDHQVNYRNKSKIIKGRSVQHIWKGSIFSHQSSLVRKEILKKYKFNISNKISADYELFYNLVRGNKGFEYIPIVFSVVSSGGISDVNRKGSIVSRWNILDKTFRVNIYYLALVIIEMLKMYAKIILRQR